jgi:DNA-binding PadR family transcriptional regulator
VLGLLIERPGYGYQVQQRFRDRFDLLGLSAKGVYSLLDRLQDEQLIKGERRVGRTRRGAPKVVYEATDAGVAAFRTWMASPLPLDVPREELHLRILLAEPEHLDDLFRWIEEQVQACLGQLRGLTSPSLAEVSDEAMPWSEAARLLVGDGLARRLQAHVDWLETVQAVLAHRLKGTTGADS